MRKGSTAHSGAPKGAAPKAWKPTAPRRLGRIGSWGGAKLRKANEGRWGYILAWLLGVPIPILLIVYLLRGCT